MGSLLRLEEELNENTGNYEWENIPKLENVNAIEEKSKGDQATEE